VRRAGLIELGGPVAVLAAVGIAGAFTAADTSIEIRNALVNSAIVIALYVFVGNSGVLSFGHVSFVAVGAFVAALATVEAVQKAAVSNDLYGFLTDLSTSSPISLLLAALAGGAYAFLVGIPLMRLSGLAAGIATFAVLGITFNLFQYWTKIGPGAKTLPLVPETTDLLQATAGAVAVAGIAFAYQRSRPGRQLRASREDPAAASAAGIDIHRQRLWAFTLSGALAGFAGGLYVHFLGYITATLVYLDLTLLTLAMLVVGGAYSLWGAVVGALLVSLLDTLLGKGEAGTSVASWEIDLPEGTRLVGVAAVMFLILVFRPRGITGGREFSLRPLRRLARARPSTPASSP
jgi:branched-chain amino acid transport system permease protein